MAGTVRLDIDGAVATITLDNQDKRNSIDLPMASALVEVTQAVRANEALGAVILRGAGERAFCAGAYFDALTGDGTATAQTFMTMDRAFGRAIASLQKIEIPVVAMVNGACFGGGVQLLLTADIRIAAEHARFGVPAATLGIVYSLDAIAEMIRTAGPGNTAHFLLGAEPLDAAGALAHHFVDRVVAPSALQETVTTLARRIAGHPRAAVRAYKTIIRGFAAGWPIDELRAIQNSAHQSPELAERLCALAQKRAAKA